MVPSTSVTHGVGGLGLLPGCVGVPGGAPCPVEVDAFSYGLDDLVRHNAPSGSLQWSVDTFALGAGPVAPNITSEAPVGDSATDVMLNIGFLAPLPLPPGPSIGHRGLYAGDGMYSPTGFTYPGLGLIEPSPPSATPLGIGDNLDALDITPPGGVLPAVSYFSLDTLGADPLTGLPHNGSAPTHGFSGGDVLKSVAGMPPVLYAPAGLLGLDFAGPHTDDLDALILWDNGDGIYQPSFMPFDWLAFTNDQLLFSVRRGSAVIGMPDSIFGIPIEEGDILTTPLLPALGGLSPFPGIIVAAENLGMGTVRTGSLMADDVDGLDYYKDDFSDCDMDGMDDTLAIALGAVPDLNMNGIPDSCEVVVPVCVPLPNSTGFPTALAGAVTGSPGTGFHLEATSGPPTMFGYFLIGTGTMSPGAMVGSGLLCLDTSGAISRYVVPGTVMNSVGMFDAAGVLVNLVGTSTVGTGFDVPTPIPTPIGGTITTGSTWHFQLWHRDIPATSNFSNTVSHTF